MRDPLLWGERVRVADELVYKTNLYARVLKAFDACKTDEERSSVQRVLDEGKADIERLGDRLLQLAAATDSSSASN
jgi:hypothetical protein